MLAAEKKVLASIDEMGTDICTLSDEIFDHPEIGYDEHYAARAQMDYLRAQGFEITWPLAKIRTAFSARYGSGKPVIGLLGEFDALSGLSQEPGVYTKKPVVTDGLGHGCGHNLLGCASLAAAVAVKNYLENGRHAGTVIYYACPAEENGSGKAFMARDGVFDELDCALTWHPGDTNAVSTASSLANILVDYDFEGIAAHAAGAPHLGRSALDAVTLMNTGVQFLREHIIPEARIHYAVLNAGGVSPNVVQSSTCVRYMIRAPKISDVLEIYDRVNDIARGAALMTGTKEKHRFIKACSDIQPNLTLAELLEKNMKAVPLPEITKEDLDMAAALRKTYQTCGHSMRTYQARLSGAEAKKLDKHLDDPICTMVMPLLDREDPMPGSSDVGDVSQVCPTAQFTAATEVLDTPGHSWQLTAQGKSHLAHEAELYAAKVLAASVLDLLNSPDLIRKAKEEYTKRRNGQPFVSPIPKRIKPPVPVK